VAVGSGEDFVCCCFGIGGYFTLPKADHGPAKAFSCGSGEFVALTVSRHFRLPEFCVRARKGRLASVDGTGVPPAAVNKYCHSGARQHDVWHAAGCQPAMKAEPATRSVKSPAKQQLRLCVGLPAPGEVASFMGRNPGFLGHFLIVPYPRGDAQADRPCSLGSVPAWGVGRAATGRLARQARAGPGGSARTGGLGRGTPAAVRAPG
jgi:hypothetical protein